MHSCPACPKSFPSPYKLQRHYVIHTGQKPFVCTLCGTSFTQSGHLKTHLQKVHQPRPLQDGVVTHRHQQAEPHHQPFLGINARGSYNCGAAPSAAWSSSSVAFQPEWRRDDAPHRTERPPVDAPGDASAVTDPITRERDGSANEDASAVDARRGYTRRLGSESPTPSPPRLWNRSPPPPPTPSGLRASGELSSGGRKATFAGHGCPLCLKTFSSPSKLRRHALIHTGQKPFSCGICRKAFRQKVHLKSHLSSENTCSPSGNPSVELELQCKISLNAVQQQLVRTDIKAEEAAAAKPEESAAAAAAATSGRCLRRTESDERERRRAARRSTPRPFPSGIDRRAPKSEGPADRRREMRRDRRHEGGAPAAAQRGDFDASDSEDARADPAAPNVSVKPETCSVDCSDFRERLPLDWEGAAAWAERREPPFDAAAAGRPRTHECRECFKRFPSASKLQRHTMSHTGQRPFGCETCGKRFRQKTHLRVHCRTHLWSKYHRQRSLYINRPPSCRGGVTRRTAAEAAVQETPLREDRGTHAGGDVVSLRHLDQTPRALIIPSYHRESEKSSPLISKQKEVASPVSTATPIANSPQNPSAARHECPRCSKWFPSASKLRRHEMIHTGLKPFLCVSCGKTFRQATHLKSHERTHGERTASEPGRRREDARTPRAESRWRPRIGGGIPQRDISVSGGGAACAGGHVVSAVLCTGPAASPVAKGNRLLQPRTKFKSNIACRKKKLYTCRICFQNFAFPYKLSGHLATHSGARPHKCSACGRSFAQLGHLKVHERRCRRVTGDTGVGDTDQEKCPDDPSGRADCRAEATREPAESRYARVGPPCPDGGASYLSEEEVHPDWLAVSEVDLQEEVGDSGGELRDDYRAPCDFDQAADLSSYSFPSELCFEMDKLVQNPNAAAPLFPQFESAAHDGEEEPRRPDAGNQLPGGEPGAASGGGHARRDDDWCEPLSAFECSVRSAVLRSESHLRRHVCPIDVRPKTTESARRNRCDVCFKHFVSPSKLKRHELIHTGVRPFRCDICGKTFTQSGHVRTHRLTH